MAPLADGPILDEEAAAIDDTVIDGNLTTARWLRGIVKIRTEGGYCSGGLLSPRIVLTAAHCKKPWRVDVYTSHTERYEYDVQAYKYHDNWEWRFLWARGTNRHDDIQVVYLDEAVPSTVAQPLRYDLDLKAAKRGALVVGYGRSETDSSGDGRKRRGNVDIVHNDGSIEAEPGASDQYAHKGDSGTMYLQRVPTTSSSYKVVAVHSGRDDGINGKGAQLADKADWIEDAIERLERGESSGSL